MDDDLMVSVVGGWLVWGLTYATRNIIPEGELRDKLRHWTPEIAAVLAVAVVAAWQAVEGQDVWTGETLKRALSAAGAAVFGHSLVAEKLKIMRKSRGGGGGTPSGTASKLGVVLPFVLVMGCGGGAVQGLDYLPDVQITNSDGCPDVSIRQPLPAPKGWSVMTETRIKRECPKPPTPPPSDSPQDK